jgi:hypothetical protein
MKRLISIPFMLMTPWVGVAQEMPLWRLENLQTGQGVPSYGGGMSPFMLSAPAPVMTTANSTEGEDEAALAAQRENLLQQARQLTQPKRALTPAMYAPAKALTNGGKGLRVLVGGEWIGVGDKMPLNYVIRQDARQALLELQRVDEEAARELANALESAARDYKGKPSTLKAIDPEKRQIVLSGALGDVVLQLNLAE